MVKNGLFFILFCLMNSFLYAYPLTVVTELMGKSNPAGKIYLSLPGQILKDVSLVAGFSAAIPGDRDKEVDTQVLLGVSTEVPLLGVADWYLLFENANGMIPNTRSGSDFYCKSLVLSKSFMYPVTDRIQLGVTAALLEFTLDGSRILYVMQTLSPSLGVKINL